MIKPEDNAKRYGYLLFDQNNDINMLPPTVIITNESDQLKSMSYYYKNLLQSRNVEAQIYVIINLFSETDVFFFRNGL